LALSMVLGITAILFGCSKNEKGQVAPDASERQGAGDQVDHKETRVCEVLFLSPPVYSSDGCHLAWPTAAAPVRTTARQVVVDGVEGPVYDGIGQDSRVFSPDSQKLAYMAQKGRKWFIVVQSVAGSREEWPAFEGFAQGSIHWSQDSKRLSY